jgi:hypothetical protein
VYISKEKIGRDARGRVELVKLDERVGGHALVEGTDLIIRHQDSMNLPPEIQMQM